VKLSAGSWVADAAWCLQKCCAKSPADLHRGSGLYFKAHAWVFACRRFRCDTRSRARAAERDGVEALHAELTRRDPVSANA